MEKKFLLTELTNILFNYQADRFKFVYIDYIIELMKNYIGMNILNIN